MIVTRTWLEKYIDLDGISNQELYETFNRIGLEVDSIKEYKIPSKVVVGRIAACGRHPDADKLSLCQIDVGEGEPRQIICGAANVVDAEYVAVAKTGAVLPDGTRIKPVKLRGVESYGMVCSSEELGLPKINDGIMILDDSIGELEVGRELNEYPRIADTVIELELTANRGDCLSIHGVARDLSAALDRELKKSSPNTPKSNNIGIARKLEVHAEGSAPCDLIYLLAQNNGLKRRLAIDLRLAFVGLDIKGKLENLIRYSSHATGVILHAYDAAKFQGQDGRIKLSVKEKNRGQVVITHDNKEISIVGIAETKEFEAVDDTKEILFEASYIKPDTIVEAVATQRLKTDPFYYNTSRGSEPDLRSGTEHLQHICECAGECLFYEGEETVKTKRETRIITANLQTINAIIGSKISKTTTFGILKRLGFEVQGGSGDKFGVHIPPHRHDIVNLYDVAEEIMRMVGIDNIEARALEIVEKNRLSNAEKLFRARRDIRQRAASAGFYEAVTYAFADRSKLLRYGFETVNDDLELSNPIVEELNTLRTTLMTNLLEAIKRNISYGIKKIALFEIGSVFDSTRNESSRIAFVWSGQADQENVSNHGKPKNIDFAAFVERITRISGPLRLTVCEESNGLIHPYQSAAVVKAGRKIGYITKLHPAVAKEYGFGDTFVAEFDLESFLPTHISAHQVSNYQGTYKDISVVVDKDTPYADLAEAIASVDLPLLKKYYVIDVYEDESLGDKKSVTIRLFLQSMEGTLSDAQIEKSVSDVLDILEKQCRAALR